jgi:SAM-dependent methyltransferase
MGIWIIFVSRRLPKVTLNPPCPICGASAVPLFYAGEHRMFRCTGCALAFVSPVPSDEYLARFYSIFHEALEAGGGYELTEGRMNADFPAKIDMVIAQHGSANLRLLDVGCGKGFFVKACTDRGIDATGVDLSDTAVNYAVDVLGVRAICGRLEDNVMSLADFDVVTFWATIEHVPDPLTTMRNIYKVLKPGGLVILDTGIGNDWLDRILPGLNQWYDPPQHLYVFSAAGMERLLQRAGFELIHIDRNFERDGVRRIARILRGVIAATALRFAAEIGRCVARNAAFNFTRFPIGNLMSVVARKQP